MKVRKSGTSSKTKYLEELMHRVVHFDLNCSSEILYSSSALINEQTNQQTNKQTNEQ